jgi:hypothetical protein
MDQHGQQSLYFVCGIFILFRVYTHLSCNPGM